jgi:hypothetical protein
LSSVELFHTTASTVPTASWLLKIAKELSRDAHASNEVREQVELSLQILVADWQSGRAGWQESLSFSVF